jgi:hypothetical protein
MSRKHMPLLIGGLVALLLALALFYLLFSSQSRYAEGDAGLATVKTRLQRLSGRAVFPSEGNVQTLGKQLTIYQEYLDGLYAAMREGQRETNPVNRDGFRRLLEEGLNRLMNDARSKSVKIAPDFAFGVQRYIEGAPPSDEDLPRLEDQFASLGVLCRILFEAGIGELVGVERTVFEKDAQVAPVEEEFNRRSLRNRPDAAAVAPSTELFKDPDGLFTKEHYVLSYRAQDAANWKVLDRLAQGAPFVVVTKMEISNPARPAVVPPKAPDAAPAPSQPVSTDGWMAPPGAAPAPAPAAPEVLPRELRVVAGQELSNVRLEVDLYRFAEAASIAETGEENP